LESCYSDYLIEVLGNIRVGYTTTTIRLNMKAAFRARLSAAPLPRRLTPRERRVLHEVARGRMNKQIAFDLGISEVTVKLHRGNVMRKMRAASIGELIRTWETLPMPLREACAA